MVSGAKEVDVFPIDSCWSTKDKNCCCWRERERVLHFYITTAISCQCLI